MVHSSFLNSLGVGGTMWMQAVQFVISLGKIVTELNATVIVTKVIWNGGKFIIC